MCKGVLWTVNSVILFEFQIPISPFEAIENKDVPLNLSNLISFEWALIVPWN